MAADVLSYRQKFHLHPMTSEEKKKVRKVSVIKQWLDNIRWSDSGPIRYHKIGGRLVAIYSDYRDPCVYVMGTVLRERSTSKTRTLEVIPIPSYKQETTTYSLKKLGHTEPIKFW